MRARLLFSLVGLMLFISQVSASPIPSPMFKSALNKIKGNGKAKVQETSQSLEEEPNWGYRDGQLPDPPRKSALRKPRETETETEFDLYDLAPIPEEASSKEDIEPQPQRGRGKLRRLNALVPNPRTTRIDRQAIAYSESGTEFEDRINAQDRPGDYASDYKRHHP